jgi:Amt family ammonium transporter
MATLVVWTLIDYFRTGHATAVGAATGIVVGLVAITPAAGFVSPSGALLLGGIAALPSYFVIALRSRTRIDDSLDVFAGHGVGGLTGALLTGVLAQKIWNSAGNDGLLYGNTGQLGVQALGALSSALYAGLMTFVILKVLGLVMSLRALPRIEGVGMDVSQHGEEAYASGEGSILVHPEGPHILEPIPALTPHAASR